MVILSCGFNFNGQLCYQPFPIKCCTTQFTVLNSHHKICTKNDHQMTKIASTGFDNPCDVGNDLSNLEDVIFTQNHIYWRKGSTWNVTGQQASHIPSAAKLVSIQKIATNLHRTVGINYRGEVVQYSIDGWHIIPIVETDLLSCLSKNDCHCYNLQEPTRKRKLNELLERYGLQSRCKAKKQFNDEDSLCIVPFCVQSEVAGTNRDSYGHINDGGSIEMESESVVEGVQEYALNKMENNIIFFVDILLLDDNTLFLLDQDGRLWQQEQNKLDHNLSETGSASTNPNGPVHLFWPQTSDCGCNGTESEAPDRNANLKLMSNCNFNKIPPKKCMVVPLPSLCPSVTNVHVVAEVTVGLQHSLLRTSTGAVFTWGDGMRGQLGVGELCRRPHPSPIPLLEGVFITSVAAGGWHCLALGSCGEVYVWGWNSHGQLGLPCKPSHQHDDLDDDLTRGCQACNCAEWLRDACSGAAKDSPTSPGLHTVRGSSTPTHGSLGRATVNVQSSPLMLEALGEADDVVAVAAGDRHSLFLLGGGAVWSCGWNKYGQRGLCCKRKRRDKAGALPQRSGCQTSPCNAYNNADVAAVSGGSDHISLDYSTTDSVKDASSHDDLEGAAVSGSSSNYSTPSHVLFTNVSASDSCFSDACVATSEVEGGLTQVPLPPAVKNIWAGGWYSVFQV